MYKRAEEKVLGNHNDHVGTPQTAAEVWRRGGYLSRSCGGGDAALAAHACPPLQRMPACQRPDEHRKGDAEAQAVRAPHPEQPRKDLVVDHVAGGTQEVRHIRSAAMPQPKHNHRPDACREHAGREALHPTGAGSAYHVPHQSPTSAPDGVVGPARRALADGEGYGCRELVRPLRGTQVVERAREHRAQVEEGACTVQLTYVLWREARAQSGALRVNSHEQGAPLVEYLVESWVQPAPRVARLLRLGVGCRWTGLSGDAHLCCR
eukprot:scaffold2921_cov124-Isochrysis_galbana.AAC.3